MLQTFLDSLLSVIAALGDETSVQYFWKGHLPFYFVLITSTWIYVFPVRLRSMLKQLEEKDVDFEEIKKNLDFTASLLEAVYLDGTR